MKKAWKKWKKITETIGNFQIFIIFSFFYFILVTPYGLVSSIFKDYFSSKSKPSWKEIEESPSSLSDLQKQ